MSPSSTAILSPPLPTPWPRFASPLKLGVMASGKGSNLEAIATAIQQGHLQAQIQVVIYNNPGAGVRTRAAQLGFPTVLLNHRHYPSREALDRAIVDTLQAHRVDWVIMAGWMRRVTPVLIDAFPRQVLNIHPSLLPSFPGVRAVEQALAAGVKVSGCTVHQVELVVDSGPVVMQAAVPVWPDDTPEILQARIQVQEHRIYPAAIALAAEAASQPSTRPSNGGQLTVDG
ncbi:phosphoribosylglycinamide formyltransferase [Nodosilinea sp. P-1105]|uniref:phosphoribosylglycinamide formyltransferase n=1 Tax=Nodosilinea sp. P-1105 TaxID=2546229 RepID=UPI00146E5B45|nr:phosphoribosylglycinamide formyltransferase [Nodosilinea sp. P-1105]NMF85621.1 phosphoribosylglycinamide formyltransferase [Nodosilinea sp. P-1105]